MKNFLGYKIEGEIYAGRARVVQRPLSEFEPLLEAVLLNPAVLGIAWDQYTPYFNDGEPCVFVVGEFYYALEGIGPQEYYDAYWMEEDAEENGRFWVATYEEDFARVVGDRSRTYGESYRDENGDFHRDWTYTNDPETRANPELFDAITALASAVGSGAFDHALLDLFGDHAQIIIDNVAKKIIVEEYNHD